MQRNVCTLYKHLSATPAAVTSDLKQRLIDSQNASQDVIDEAALVNGERSYVQAWGKRTSLWTSAKLIPALLRANRVHNRTFSEPPTVYRGKHAVSRYFHRSHLKANKVSKSEGTRKVKYAYQFWNVMMHHAAAENYQNWYMLVEATACHSWRVETQCTYMYVTLVFAA